MIESPTKQFLEKFVSVANANGHKFYGYSCLDDFILQHGKPMPTNGGELPDGVVRGLKGFCYFNAITLALEQPRRFIYCEGYADAHVGMPLMHGWCVTRQGVVVDPTWKNGKHYFGIAVKHQYLNQRVEAQRKLGLWGLLDMPHWKWPVLRAKVSAWRHPVMERLPT